MSDRVAIGAMQTIRAAGLSIPEDVSIFGFDDIPAAALSDLSTIRQPHERKGMEAVRLLTQQDGRQNKNVILETELVARGSIGPAPKG